MKISLSIDSLLKENKFLKLVTKLLFGVVFVLLLQVISLYSRDPIIIQSSTRGREILEPMTVPRTNLDLKIAVQNMLKARFDTEAHSSELFLSDKQKLLRENEQRDLKSRSMTQAIVIRNVVMSKDQAFVDLDRVIAVGDLRTAIRAKIKIAFEESEPNELNPYGLVLSLAEVQSNEVKK